MIDKGGEGDHVTQIAISLFECRLAVELASSAARTLARRRGVKEVKPQIDELAALLDQCGETFEKLTVRLDGIFNLRGRDVN